MQMTSPVGVRRVTSRLVKRMCRSGDWRSDGYFERQEASIATGDSVSHSLDFHLCRYGLPNTSYSALPTTNDRRAVSIRYLSGSSRSATRKTGADISVGTAGDGSSTLIQFTPSDPR